MRKKQSPYLLLLGLLFIGGIYYFGEEKQYASKKPYYFAPPEIIRHFTFGYNDIYADLLWIRYLQNADFCNFDKGLPVYDGKTKYSCDKGWAYHMAHAITELAPRFKKPYTVSGVLMGILMGDKEGTRIIWDKAVKQFPNDWDIWFHSGNHYLLELNMPEIAADQLLKAAQLGGPLWLYTLSAKLFSEAGRLEVAEKLLLKVMEDDPDSAYMKSFEEKLKEVQSQKKALRNKETNI